MRVDVVRHLVVAAALVGCRPHQVRLDPPPPVEVPGRFAGQGGDAAAPDAWWQAFGDPALDALVTRAIDGNLTLAAAWARLEQVEAYVVQARSGKLPAVTASVSAGRSRSRFVIPEQEQGGMTIPEIELYDDANRFSASIGAAYEVDLWSRVDSAHESTLRSAASARDSVEAIAMTLAAELTEAWLDVRFQRAREKLLVEQLGVQQKSLELLETRFREGLGSSLDVYQQRSLVAATEAQVVQSKSAVVALEGQIAILLGATFDDAVGSVATASDALPEPPPLPAVGVPASLLERRPDVRAARRLVEAADYAVAVAVADRLPQLLLQGSISETGEALVDLVKSPLYSLLASATAPLFDYGRRKAEVARTRAVVEERLADYGRVMLTAMVEVEVALAQERHFNDLIAELVAQEELAANTIREARSAYREGQIDYLPVLSAQQAQQQIQLSVLAARRQLLSLRVSLYRALGGTWTQELRHE
jgi:NodT family efflux transporter outer membrane factor (OMF) lipoprotein